MKIFRLALIAIFLSVLTPVARAIGWPYAFEGVMLQGFYWDSYQTETKWTTLEARADELARYFRLIWVPNSGQSSGGLGYIPVYWFTNHNSDMGSESQLRSMIATYKSKGTGMIADLVLNHRGGVSNWTDFPTETWNGKKWHIGLDGICCTDEVAYAAGQPKPTGAADEGQDFDGARDLDHTNANVQENCKNYAKCLLEDFGYEGFRLDMVKGYAGYYTKMYNQYAKPTFSVGEYWDGEYNALGAWIESTGAESAAFDFAFKYAVNEAFASGDLTKLVWYEDGVTPKPAGLIHHWYQQLAVTFIDNHDTVRDDWNRFNGNWAAANAFMICSPGTPCVFLPHWNACGDQIARMIEARNGMGISNTSDVRVLRSTSDCYMAELTGSKGKLVVKIGPAMVSPEGYSNDQIHCLGEDYCIWTSSKVVAPGNGSGLPHELFLMGNLPEGHWNTKVGIKMERIGSKYTCYNVTLDDVDDGNSYFSFVSAISTKTNDWAYVNAADRFGPSTKDKPIAVGETGTVKKFPANTGASGGALSWRIPAGTYDFCVDLSTMKLTVAPAGTLVEKPAKLYIIGDLEKGNWATNVGVEMTPVGSTFKAEKVKFRGTTKAYFGFATKLASTSSDWPTLNSSDRYGADVADKAVTPDTPVQFVKFAAGNDASGAFSWSVTPGVYDVIADFATHTLTIKKVETSSITDIEDDADCSATPVYYDMMGRQVASPTPGQIYIVRRGNTVTRQLYR